MRRLIYIIGFLVMGAAFIVMLSCSPKVLVPPKVDLRGYVQIGLIEFSSNAKGELQKFTTQNFLETIQAAQPGIGILELGTTAQALQSVERNELNLEAIKAIGEKFKVPVVITGALDVTKVKPKINISSLLSSMTVEAVVEATLSAKLFDTSNGATLWTNSAHGKESVGHVTLGAGGLASFNADNPKNAYGKLVNVLLATITQDFWERYERQ